MKNPFRGVSGGNWVRTGELIALRAGSLAFSLVSAHAILWFFQSLAMVDDSDPLQKYVPYVIAGGFGLLGYFVSRGLVYRLMHKEKIKVYIAICVLFEFVEMVCNFAQAVSSVPSVAWLQKVHGLPHDVLSFLLYVAYSIVPLVTFVLAVVDMDLEKAKGVGVAAPLSYRPAAPVGNAAPRNYGAVNRQAVGVPAPAPHPKEAPSEATGQGWKFPFKRKGEQAGQAAPAPQMPDLVIS